MVVGKALKARFKGYQKLSVLEQKRKRASINSDFRLLMKCYPDIDENSFSDLLGGIVLTPNMLWCLYGGGLK